MECVTAVLRKSSVVQLFVSAGCCAQLAEQQVLPLWQVSLLARPQVCFTQLNTAHMWVHGPCKQLSNGWQACLQVWLCNLLQMQH